jgi:putative SOS response-associated peptidase YedK
MCGRYQRRSDKQRIAEAFALGNVDGLSLELAPDYNAAPQSMQPVIVWDRHEGMRKLQMMFWRFLPPFVTDPKRFKLDTINAQGEKLLESKMWRGAFLHNRCLIPADSFVEWERADSKTKLPWIFAMKHDEPFALGGVWRHWRSGEVTVGEAKAADGRMEMDTFAIITVEPNELLAEKTGHDRMPLIVKRSDYQRWLEPGNKERPSVDLLKPYDSEKMKAWRVDTRINNVRNNDPALSEPLREQTGGQLGLFGG